MTSAGGGKLGWRVIADVAAFEGRDNPAGGPLDSNPYGIEYGGGRLYIADAGGNTVVAPHTGNRFNKIAVLPSLPVPAGPFNPPFAAMEGVPTEVKLGPDGALYVSGLTGAPFLPGAASIYRVVPGQAPVAFQSGFTQIVDFDWSGSTLYVLEYGSAPFLGGVGSLIRVDASGTRSVVLTGLTSPTGVLVGPEKGVYVTNRGNVAAVGEVLRIVP
jgi:hypothetical protein